MKAKQCQELFGYPFVGNPEAEVCEEVVTLMRNTKVMEQRSQEWYEQRKKVISASDIASAIGDNPHKSIDSLVKDKVFGTTFTGNIHTEHGQKYEPVATEMFATQYNHTVFEFGLLPHPHYQFIGGSPDGICADGSVIEIKCPLTRQIKHGEVPVYYYPQIQTVLDIVDMPVNRAYFIQYKPAVINHGEEIFSVIEVPRSKPWFQEKLPMVVKFWKDVMFYREHPYMLDPCKIVEGMYD